MQPDDQKELDFENEEADLLDNDYHEGVNYSGLNFNQFVLTGHTFEDCSFTTCQFKEMSLAGVAFSSCKFINSEIVLTKTENMTLNSVLFSATKILGLNFTDCNSFGFSPEFENCLIDSAVFCQNNLKKVRFIACRIRNTDFMESDMRESDFSESEFETTIFQKCNLEKADFRTARHYSIDPLNNRLKKARFRLPEAQSFLGFLGIEIE